MLEIGSLLEGRYRILREVGHGGMSTVYLAVVENANRHWAVKEIRRDGGQNSDVKRQNLIAEKQILVNLEHKYLPGIAEVIEKEDNFYLVMDYIQGVTLEKKMEEQLERSSDSKDDRNSALPQKDVIKWAIQLCEVLMYLHSRPKPIIYRDMKPSNIMLKPDGDISLIDFGAAREYKNKEGVESKDTISIGTIGYAAPEQYGDSKRQTDARTDIYNLGATLYHLVTGIFPLNAPGNTLAIREVNPLLSHGLEKVILKCTNKSPEDRYQSAAELLYDLEYGVAEEDEHLHRKQVRKIGAFVASSALTILFAGTALWGYLSAEGKRNENYDYILTNADSVEAYYDAILTDPTRTEAYLGSTDSEGLVQYLISDGVLTSEESTRLLKLKAGLDKTNARGYTNSVMVLDSLLSSNPKGFADVCNEIGEAYLFYYDIGVEKDKYNAASSWFQYAREEYPVAGMYCDISDCLQNISKYAKSEQYAKLSEEYENLWQQVTSLKEKVEEYDDDLKLRVWNEIVNMIQNNAGEFCEVTSPDEIIEMLDQISDDSSLVKNTFLQNSIQDLQNNVAVTRTKIESAR
ncbi:MAG: serine/threonine protein kinase [Lachnospiraceae bacterium]|nr:serine/threonine protein kinase [Lachnospiraceae bacterium]